MPGKSDIIWFKQQFREKIIAAIEGTPFTVDMLTALACQETGEIWPILRKKGLSVDRILELCVGDTIDKKETGGRTAFPQKMDDLIAVPNGQQMFDLAREALVEMSEFIKSYQRAAEKPHKFCHGFGIFQYDIQFFKEDPEYFLEKKYADFDACLGKCLLELGHALKKLKWQNKDKLTDHQMAAVAIAYNTGRYDPERGLEQGFKSDDGKYYGENFFDFLQLSKSVELGDDAHTPSAATVSITGQRYTVEDPSPPLNLRSRPAKSSSILARLDNGHAVVATSNEIINGFIEVETSLDGERLTGFAAAKFLKATTE